MDEGSRITATIAVTINADVELGSRFTNTVYLLWREDVLSDWSSLQVGGQEPAPIYLPLIFKNNTAVHQSGRVRTDIPACIISPVFRVAERISHFLISTPLRYLPALAGPISASRVSEGNSSSTNPICSQYISRAPPTSTGCTPSCSQ